MKFKIHFTYPNGEDNWFIVEGDDIDELREKADKGVNSRGGKDPWSEEIKENIY